MKTVVIAGGIGSGKSEVCRYLEGKGVPVYYADLEVKRLYFQDKDLFPSIERALGQKLSYKDEKEKLSALADIIFSSPSALETVESIVHPALLKDFIHWKEKQKGEEWKGYAGKEPFVVIESAIILEKPVFNSSYDAVVIVEAPENLRLSRTLLRDGGGEDKIRKIMSLQKINRAKASCIINNDSDLAALYRSTDRAFENLEI